jgi:hypothetical protein
MTPALLPGEARLLERFVWFANLKEIKSDAQVEDVVAKDLVAVSYIPGMDRFGRSNFDTVRAAQIRVRDYYLHLIITGNVQSACEFVERDLKRERVTYYLDRTRNGLRYVPYIHNIGSFYAYCGFLLLDEARGAGPRLRQCLAPDCGKFHLNLTPKGRPIRFCTSAHRASYFNSLRKTKGGR